MAIIDKLKIMTQAQNHLSTSDTDDNIPSVSKSQRKREVHAIRDLGKELTQLPASQLEKFSLSESLLKAINDAKKFKKEALRRQLQYLGRLLRQEDTQAIQQTLDQLKNDHHTQTQHFKYIEQLRERLIADEQVLGDVIKHAPNANLQQLRNLRRKAIKELQENNAMHAYRQLFRELRHLLETIEK